jgi:hypothetical protein
MQGERCMMMHDAQTIKEQINLIKGDFSGPLQLLTHRSGGKHGNEEDLRWRFPSSAGCREELLDPPDLRVDGGGGSRCVLEN